MTQDGLDKVYSVTSVAEAEAFYDAWADRYERELAEAGYVTPGRCAEALAAHEPHRTAPLAEFGCGTGLGGLALRAAGFTCIDGFDLSVEMLASARDKGVYRTTETLDLS